MKRKNILWLYLFLFASLTDIAFMLEQKNELRIFSKPLIILGLVAYFYQITRPISSTLLVKSILGALIFSWIGDILLLWDSLFIYGLGAFLMAHICYIIGFRVAQKAQETPLKVNFIKTFFYNLPVYFIAAFVFYLTNPNLGAMKIPVIIYILVILSMVSVARERFGKCNPASFWQVFIGASLFFISDATIALDKFYYPIPDAGIIIMGTYVIAQLMIVMGIRSHILQPTLK
ncbi:putative membrane protein YhhN [Algoriphagus ratkowskyi]|uniref:Lysoplasmalogenase n=1 Tax=Algoriphagus ratkowskyi TaxID=57028 RepID=A0A2W7R383_9BACT|nr:lysoplasmalogenase [Algoriphagus ratkowskyi]PZX54621.1 putative membrane protein YhhN [Algoriphagus ratkowskyi]TXD76931.1 lysoplasmalogenase [Algoriphagus ratkowskyi]